MIHRTYPDGQRPQTARRDQPVSTAPAHNAPGDVLLSLQRVLLNVHGGHFSDARVRRHERRNALHTLRGLIQLARHAAERPELAAAWPGIPLAGISELVGRVEDPLVRAHLVGKMLATTERGVRLGISPRSQLPTRPDLAGALITVLGNLVDNAMDAVLDDRGTDPWIEVTVRQESLSDPGPDSGSAGPVELCVADNGPGVAVELRNRIFTRGFSTKPVSSDQRRGLGLALVKTIAEEHGGSVAVADRAGGGCLFTVRIPAPTATPTPRGPSASGRRDGDAP
ncbi:sensor histidine kinase [Streptomyces sp. NPDC057939]|uniref:sensor histidine kinase n=1 Tax=Streptomyces sp. NPDC057939 TaxID=3346284 RepID=UPI0036E224BE